MPSKLNVGVVMDPNADKKRRAAEAAAALVRDGMTLGLGTGSTVHFWLEAVARRIHDENLRVSGVPTSSRTEHEARRLGIPLTTLDHDPTLDFMVDGADEIDGRLNLIKGGGGALVREKVVASSTKDVVIIADEGKLVPRLGTTYPVPVEVLPFARPYVDRGLRALGGTPTLRKQPNGSNFITDNGNWIVDARFGGIPDPVRFEREITMLSGVLDCGIFTGLADVALIGTATGVRRLEA